MPKALKIRCLLLRPHSTIKALKAVSAARAAARQHDWKTAREHYAQALAYNPDQARVWIQYGHALGHMGQASEAMQAYARGTAMVPSADSFLQLGRSYKILGMREAAIEAFRKSLALDPTNKDSRLELIALGGAVMTQKPVDFAPDAKFLKKNYNIDIGSDAISEKDRKAFERKGIYLNLSHFLHHHGLTTDFLALFDHDYYAQKHKITGSDPDDLMFNSLKHFTTAGVRNQFAVRKGMEFEPAFYQENYGLPDMSREDIYRYWLNQGIMHGHAPNSTVWMALRKAFEYGESDGDAANLIDNLEQSTLIAALVRGDMLQGIRPTARTAFLFQMGAEYLFDKGEGKSATLLLERLLDVFPHHEEALLLYAEYQITLEQYLLAKWCFGKLGKDTRHGYRFRLGMAKCALGLVHHDKAYDDVVQLIRDYPAIASLRDLRWKIAELYFRAATRSYQDQAHMERRADGIRALDRYCAVVTQDSGAEVLPPRPIRSVALFGITELEQCYFYRILQKEDQIKAAGFNVAFYDANRDQETFLADINRFDAVIFYRVFAYPSIIRVVEAARVAGLITFYEIDDLLFQSQHYPDPYETYAGQITYAQHIHEGMGPPLTLGVLRMCDYAIASTAVLAEAMQPYVRQKKAFLHQNAMGADHECYLTYKPPEADNDVITIFYGSGTRAHKQDFLELLEPALLEIARRHGARVRFVILGWLPLSDTFRKEVGDRLTLSEPIWDIHQYWSLLSRADINLAVLKRSPHTDAKSENKWMEAAMFAIPSIVSHTPAYEAAIEDGRTGIMCSTTEEWTDALDLLVSDNRLRRQIGLNAQAEVHEKYSLSRRAENIKTIFNTVSPPVVPDTRKRLLVVHVFYAPQVIGGATRVVHDNVMYIKQNYGNEFNIDVVCVIDGAEKEYEIETYAWEGVRVKAVTRSHRGEGIVPYHDRKMGDIFSATLKEFQPDIIHFHCIQRLTVSVVDVAREANIPYVITAHDSWWISDEQFIDEKQPGSLYNYSNMASLPAQLPETERMQALKPALDGAKAILAVSEAFAALYRSCGVPHVMTVENGLSAFPAPCEKSISPTGRVRLALIGGMAQHKGFDLIREVLKTEQFHNLHFTVIDLSRMPGFRRVEEWGTTPVEILGKVPDSQISQLYRHIDVLLAPSCWFESYGLVTREALAHKCWVVSSDRGAIGQPVVENRNGHIIDVSSTAGLKTILHKIDAHPEIYTHPPEFETKLRSAAEQGEELVDIYRQALETGHLV
ncbi:glycosyltransferase [Komagataeibacter europaeus]|uniref:glycosyltransferase n=1 Tax=Komagataeibacter europaeus TaxID=33995 RepID=UPI0012DC45F3|nr:glycosyltransferase [Komagataeibacter europaeus]